jgi:hypothetical protein
MAGRSSNALRLQRRSRTAASSVERSITRKAPILRLISIDCGNSAAVKTVFGELDKEQAASVKSNGRPR